MESSEEDSSTFDTMPLEPSSPRGRWKLTGIHSWWKDLDNRLMKPIFGGRLDGDPDEGHQELAGSTKKHRQSGVSSERAGKLTSDQLQGRDFSVT